MRPPETRHSLLVRLKDSRNDLAWTEFVCAYEPFLMRLVRRQGTPERHVADVTQHGPIVWKRFNATSTEILWYYNSMLALFTKYLEPSQTLLHRYTKVVAEMQQLEKDA